MVQQATIPRRTLVIFVVLAVVFLAQMTWWIIFNVSNFKNTNEKLRETLQNEREIVASILNNQIRLLAQDSNDYSSWGFQESNIWNKMISGCGDDIENIPPDSLTLILSNKDTKLLVYINRDYLRKLASVSGKTELSGNLNGLIMNPGDAIKAEDIAIDDSWLKAIESGSDRHIRMLVMEGSFFIFLILIGLWMVYSAIRKKRTAAEEQTLFYHSITHELKIPITSVNLFLDTIKRRDYDPGICGELMPKMKEDLRRLNGLIDNILSIRKLSEKRPEKLPRIELSSVVRNFVGTIRDKVESSGGILEDKIEEGLSIRAGTEEIQRVWDTLIDNSLKYAVSPELKIEIILKRSASKAVLEITDNGPGIPSERKDILFRKFSRGEDENSRSVSGSGLGLYIAKEYINRNGGSIDIDTPDAGGCRVTMKFDIVP